MPIKNKTIIVNCVDSGYYSCPNMNSALTHLLNHSLMLLKVPELQVAGSGDNTEPPSLKKHPILSFVLWP